ncbi:fatty acid desaturase [Echinicola sp. CAU 1574]|uniref:Fatty acid desaturase n=1 Tax=Echinicola arenosa TaxID=2774144 RepID=A0ABR9AL95_9BACT|nr:fatty acid desaturase [Echinicola arenosa]
MIHQLLKTCNYSENNRVFSWLIEGLNYQIEHHLFLDICMYTSIKLLP